MLLDIILTILVINTLFLYWRIMVAKRREQRLKSTIRLIRKDTDALVKLIKCGNPVDLNNSPSVVFARKDVH